MYDAGDGRMARRWALGSLLAAAAVAAAVGSTASPVAAAPPVRASAVSVRSTILELLAEYRDGDLHTRRSVRDRLLALGPKAVPTIFAVFSGRIEPGESDSSGPLLDRNTEQLMLDALRAWRTERVVELLMREIDYSAESHNYGVVLRILGEVGDARSMEAIFEVLEDIDPVQLRRPSFVSRVVDGLRKILERDRLGYNVLLARLHDMDPRFVPSLVRALGELGRLEGVPILERLLHRSDDLDVQVLAALGQLRVRDAAASDGTSAYTVRFFLTATDARVRRQAVVSLSRLHDTTAFVDLVDLLEDPDAGVARAALEALRSLSGRRWSSEPAAWLRWYRGEKDWLERQALELSAIIREDSTPGAALKAIRKLSEHQLFRSDVAELIVPALHHRDGNVAAAGCHALKRLGEPKAIVFLIDALDDNRAVVREAAAVALRSLTGREFDPDFAQWRDWLEG